MSMTYSKSVFFVKIILLALLTKPLFASNHMKLPSVNVALATGGVAQLPIIIPSGASVDIQNAANYLSTYLTKITGATFSITSGNGSTGIALGTIESYPSSSFSPTFNLTNIAEKQGYEIKSHTNGIYVIGATISGLNYAISDLLNQLGYRHYFPMDIWEVIPNKPDLSFDKHIREIPDYFTRRIFPGFSYWPEYRESGSNWDKVNKNGGYELRTSHVYDEIISNNITAFNAHPEYYGLVNGVRNSSKMCISNPDLRTLVVNYILGRFAANPSLDSYSMEPSDGPGWCECSSCIAIGTPSTRAVFLANTVAAAVRANYTGKKIGMYAYFQHSLPPNINVDQDVVVSVATSDRYLEGAEPVDSVLFQWQNKNAVLGIREYGDVLLWSKHLPGNSNSSNFEYLAGSIKKYYNDYGARYHISQATDGWGASGLGFYLSTKMMWNVNECDKIDSLKEDFFTNSFGAASLTMKNYYDIIDGTNPRLLSRDMIGRMYRQLDTARVLASADTSILKRIGDMALYTRYSELYLNLTLADAANKQEEYNKLLQLIVDQKSSRMIHSYEVYLHKRFSPSNGTDPSELSISWSNPTRPSFAQIDSIIQNGIAANSLVTKEEYSYVNQGQYEYRSTQSGNWNDLNSWEVYTGWAWEPASTVINPGNVSNVSKNYTIRPSHTITLSSSAAYCTNLNVMSGGALLSGSNNYDLRMGAGELPYAHNSAITNNGVIDGLQLEIWTNTANAKIEGSGTYRLGMLRARGGNPNPLNITIDQDITLYLGSSTATFTLFKDDINNKTTDDYTLTLNSGKTINLTGNAPFHLPGDKTNNQAGNYTYNINGTLNLSGATSRNSHFIASATNSNAISTLNVSGNLILSKGFNTVSSIPTSGEISLSINGGLVDATATTSLNIENSYFKLNETGKLKRLVGNTDILFPVGTPNSYNPTIINNSGVEGAFTVGVTSSFVNPLPTPSKAVDKQWNITTDNSSAEAKISLGWLDENEGSQFINTEPVDVIKLEGTQWKPTLAVVSGDGTKTSPRLASAQGFTNFGTFGIMNRPTRAEYRSKSSGNWSAATTWEKKNGDGSWTESAPPTGTSTNSHMTIRNGDTVTLDNLFYCTNLVVETGASLVATSTTNRTLRIGAGTSSYSDDVFIINNGEIGIVDPNRIVIEPWTTIGKSLTISGSGTTNIGALRVRGGNPNPIEIIIDQDLRITQGGDIANFTLFDNANTAATDNYTLTINTGKTVKIDANTLFHMHNNTTTRAAGKYIYNINGTLDLNNNSLTRVSHVYPFTTAGSEVILNVSGTVILGKGGFGTVNSYASPVGTLALNIGGLVDASATNSLTMGTNFFKTADGGTLSRWVDNTDVYFPIGVNSSATYNPVILKNTGTAGPFSVHVSGLNTLVPDSSKVVKREWNITPLNEGSNATISLGWLTADQGSNFNTGDSVLIFHQVDTGWTENPAIKSGSGSVNSPYYATTSFSTYGKFIIENLPPPAEELKTLSVKLLKDYDSKVELTWSASDKPNCSSYSIERSLNSKDFKSIGKVMVANETTNYSFIDNFTIEGLSY
jgi:hypothetical protein